MSDVKMKVLGFEENFMTPPVIDLNSLSNIEELGYEMWDLLLEYLSYMGLKAENEDEPDFAVVKEVEKTFYEILKNSGVVFDYGTGSEPKSEKSFYLSGIPGSLEKAWKKYGITPKGGCDISGFGSNEDKLGILVWIEGDLYYDEYLSRDEYEAKVKELQIEYP